MAERPGEAVMSITTALIRVGYLLDRYAGCDSQVLRVISATDEEAVKVLADAVRNCDWCPAAADTAVTSPAASALGLSPATLVVSCHARAPRGGALPCCCRACCSPCSSC